MSLAIVFSRRTTSMSAEEGVSIAAMMRAMRRTFSA